MQRARELARHLLASPLPQRWIHVQAVADEAHRLSWILPPAERSFVVAAAWLHDIGYAPAVSDTGLHALDGARYLRALGVPDRLCGLVAHHSSAATESQLAGRNQHTEFGGEVSAASDLLWFCDMTIGHDGRGTTLEQRLAEITIRYPAGDVVRRAIRQAEPDLAAAVARTQRRLDAARPLRSPGAAQRGSVDPGGRVVAHAAVDAQAGVGVDVERVELAGGDPDDLG